ncbi:ABC1 kinase family protein [Synoicihabitans lomoniglobus]|uniref:AarF/UbiB family protein n=1 Tax=Synoicihabitans lomoniglobus TaxID=2909285 RepID=A0AAE9ZXN0_9BACT|nr:AarF/UbiB family protein [Opitutaceae bacterium LMO-M01]WED65024.1 AarF/UbiB family protein [Opitutaceae bacterium LMO-M01]
MKPFDLLGNAVRAKEIFTVFAKHGFADFINQLDLPAPLTRRFRSEGVPQRSKWERIRLAAEELGPAWVKFGQLLSMRPDLIPHPLILELRKLQNAVPPMPFASIRARITEELEGEPIAVFAEFNEVPIAAASLAQVYFAKLREDGSSVAVKVQRPGIARSIRADLDLAKWLAHQLHQRIDGLKPYDLPSVVEAVQEGVERELDFRYEARNQTYFNTINPVPDHVFAPRVYDDYTTDKLLVMERIDGTPIGPDAVPAEQARKIASHGARSIVHQVLIDGFFHADPHAGNVIIATDGRLCFLDWGLSGHLTRRLRYALADFWVAAVEGDAERVVRIAADLAPTGARTDLRAMEKDVTLALREELNFAIGRQEIGRAMLKLLFVFGDHGIPLSRDYAMMAKSVLAIEEVGRVLDPKFDLRSQAAPVLRQLYKERSGPRAMARRSREFIRGALAGLQDLPTGIHRLVRRFEQDDLTINLEHKGLDDLDNSIETASNRITLGVVSGSLIIGSSMIVTTGIRPLLFGYPALGIIGYLMSAMVGFYIVWDIVRHGKHK